MRYRQRIHSRGERPIVHDHEKPHFVPKSDQSKEKKKVMDSDSPRRTWKLPPKMPPNISPNIITGHFRVHAHNLFSPSRPKSSWPGVSTMLIKLLLNILVHLDRIVLSRSRPRSFESITLARDERIVYFKLAISCCRPWSSR